MRRGSRGASECTAEAASWRSKTRKHCACWIAVSLTTDSTWGASKYYYDQDGPALDAGATTHRWPAMVPMARFFSLCPSPRRLPSWPWHLWMHPDLHRGRPGRLQNPSNPSNSQGAARYQPQFALPERELLNISIACSIERELIAWLFCASLVWHDCASSIGYLDHCSPNAR